jgi:hypothetical protein
MHPAQVNPWWAAGAAALPAAATLKALVGGRGGKPKKEENGVKDR